MKTRILAPVSADVFGRKPWSRSGSVPRAIDDAIKAGPQTAIPLQVAEAEDLKPVQHACHVYSVRKGYRVQTITDKRTLVIYVRAVRPIHALFHRAGRPRTASAMAMKALRNQRQKESCE